MQHGAKCLSRSIVLASRATAQNEVWVKHSKWYIPVGEGGACVERSQWYIPVGEGEACVERSQWEREGLVSSVVSGTVQWKREGLGMKGLVVPQRG